ncbi:MAG: hypothetical protein AAF685_12025 [Cyanobacteria bacterium P01_C01_bin.89]
MTPLAQITTQPPRPVSNQQQQQNMATGLAIALTVILVLAFVFQKKGKRSGRLGVPTIHGHGRVSGRIRRQLENKVGSGTAMRLVDYERSRVPGKSENWYWQAALERLARDHGRR